jgi:hypothetical protein
LSGGKLKNRFTVIPAEAGIQSTDSLRQRNPQSAHMLHKAGFLTKTLKCTPSYKAWHHHHLVWLPVSMVRFPVPRLREDKLHKDDGEKPGYSWQRESYLLGTSSLPSIQSHSTKLAIDPRFPSHISGFCHNSI